MKVVALLSGGKDSCFNLVHCVANGHEIVAAASLGPGPGKEELDSYMYQTVGQDAIDYVARAMDLPLYRRVISGAAVEQGNEYGTRDASKQAAVSGDETEDLYELLKIVIDAHPDVKGVSVGAILSNYQRVRVEHVCRRLSLTALSYLWQRDQTELLGEMIENGLDAILIKVAGAGLTSKHIGKSLAQMQPTLHRLRDMYQTHVCGEGGEYETLTLNSQLFKRPIHLQTTEIVMIDDNDVAPVAFLRVKDASLGEPSADDFKPPKIPSLLEEKWESLLINSSLPPLPNAEQRSAPYNPQLIDVGVTAERWLDKSSWHSLSNITVDATSITIEQECTSCWELVRSKLEASQLTLMHISHVNVYLASMDYFPAINAVMYSLFGTSPPTRACVAVDIPSPQRVCLDIIAHRDNDLSQKSRQALHVQGISYWAPANIGPYSQSITIERQRMFVSGQIGLIPASMTMPSPPNILLEMALSLQHADRIATLTMDTLGTSSRDYHNDSAILWMTNVNDVPDICHAWNIAQQQYSSRRPTAVLVGAKELPRAAQVEAQLIYNTALLSVYANVDADDEDEDIKLRLEWSKVDLPLEASSPEARITAEFQRNPNPHAQAPVAWIGFKSVTRELLESSKIATRLQQAGFSASPLHIRAFYTPAAPAFFLQHASEQLLGTTAAQPITPIPVEFLATSDGVLWDAVVYIL
ncbi:adenine nucleotide alpha hydrolases-like protein [Clavulina sp. PMI_390]|nr:adenine nucleotide alpha hydrolases-like protein [Clavulina sp. PMI_390]